MSAPTVLLLPWDIRGRALLDDLNTPEGKLYLGGPEPPEKLDERHGRYLTYRELGGTEMLMVAAGGTLAGATGYWRDGDGPYEAGWEILPAFQGAGIASRAVALMLARLLPHRRTSALFAYPAIDNLPSNRLCASIGFRDCGVKTMEYPRDVWSAHRVWRLDLDTWSPGKP